MHLIFSTIFITLFLFISLYIYRRFILKINISSSLKNLLKVFLLINYLFIIVYLLGKFIIDMPYIVYYIASLSIGILFLFFLITIVYDISRTILNKSSISIHRRSFLKKSLDYLSIIFLGTITSKAIYNARKVQVLDVDIKIKNLHQPYSIVQISDVHISKLIDKKYIKNIVNTINKLNADIVVITGDLIDTNINNAQEALNELKYLKSKYGTYFIVGNHEYFYDVKKSINAVKNLGITVLENENVYIGPKDKGFNLAGVYDVFGYRANYYEPDILKALKDKQNSPTVLLSHQPRYINEIISGVDLVLSGHTHGGQIHPFNNLVKLQQPYVKGLHQHNKDLQIYINQGTGFWGPAMRLGTVCEISNIRIY